jgi:hypothetical protein
MGGGERKRGRGRDGINDVFNYLSILHYPSGKP